MWCLCGADSINFIIMMAFNYDRRDKKKWIEKWCKAKINTNRSALIGCYFLAHISQIWNKRLLCEGNNWQLTHTHVYSLYEVARATARCVVLCYDVVVAQHQRYNMSVCQANCHRTTTSHSYACMFKASIA